jgi:hypothetical protein
MLFAIGLVLGMAPATLRAQDPLTHETEQTQATPGVRDQLMPASGVALLVSRPLLEEGSAPATRTVFAARSSGSTYMIVGLALFVAGIIADGDAGTVLILAGAGIGAYGLYLHFQ